MAYMCSGIFVFCILSAETYIENEETMQIKLNKDSVQFQISKKHHLARPAPCMEMLDYVDYNNFPSNLTSLYFFWQ